LATQELTTREKVPSLRSRLRLRAARADSSRRATTRGEELGALAIGAAIGAVVGVGLVFLIAWLVT
jgi:hypothetical protein